MKKLILSLVAYGIIISANAQSMNQDVVSNAGDEFVNGGVSMSWTLGETVIETFSNASIVLTQGFHQSQVTVFGIEPVGPDLDISVYPNPTSSVLNIDFGSFDKSAIIHIADMNGKLIQKKTLSSNDILNIDHLASGMYLLDIKNEQNQTLKTFKIQKLDL